MGTDLAINTESVVDRIVAEVTADLSTSYSRRTYESSIRLYFDWHHRKWGAAPVSKATVLAYKTFMMDAGLAPATINIRLCAIRKMVRVAMESEALRRVDGQPIVDMPGVRRAGQKTGTWLTLEQLRHLMSLPDLDTVRGMRDYAVLALCCGAGLRRSEVVRLDWQNIQYRGTQLCVVDFLRKGGKMHSTAIPAGAMTAEFERWSMFAYHYCNRMRIRKRDFQVIVGVDKHDNVMPDRPTADVVWRVFGYYSEKMGIELRPHDGRRTMAALAKQGGASLESVSAALGHESLRTTQTYLETIMPLIDPACNRIGI